jgi:hypothetical protein
MRTFPMASGKALVALSALGAVVYVAMTEKDASAKVPSPDVDCHSDSECLGRRGVTKAASKVSTVVEAARLTSSVGSPLGSSWVAEKRGEGLEVVTADQDLVEGAVLLATSVAAANDLVAGGLFRRVY